MSRIYRPQDGWMNKNGTWNPGTDFVMLTASERAELYTTLASIVEVKRESGIKVPTWGRNDDKIVRNAARLLCPVHRGGANRDLTLPDLKKLWATLDKVEEPLREQVGERIEWPDSLVPTNVDDVDYHIDRREVWEHMEAQRNSTREQQKLLENPELITDNLPEFSSVWD